MIKLKKKNTIIKRHGYEFSNELKEECFSKAIDLVDDFYANAYPADTDDNSISHAKSSIFNGLSRGIKHGVYVYQDDELVGLAIYHESTTDARAISIDLIDFEPEVRKSFVCKGLDENSNKPSELLTDVITIIDGLGKKNNKSKIKLGLSDQTSCLATQFGQLGFEYEVNELKGTNIYSKRLVNNK